MLNDYKITKPTSSLNIQIEAQVIEMLQAMEKHKKITVSELDGNMGWHKVDMKIRPHFKYMGAFFTLSLVGKLDKS